MFSKLSVVVTSVLITLAAAIPNTTPPVTTPSSNQCCSSVQSSDSSAVGVVAGLLGLDLSGLGQARSWAVRVLAPLKIDVCRLFNITGRKIIHSVVKHGWDSFDPRTDFYSTDVFVPRHSGHLEYFPPLDGGTISPMLYVLHRSTLRDAPLPFYLLDMQYGCKLLHRSTAPHFASLDIVVSDAQRRFKPCLIRHTTFVAALLGLNFSGLNIPIGLGCSPITVIGNNCGGAEVTCDAPEKEWGSLIAIDCIPITL
ncbi:hypothetical protein C8R44DRAFT_873216 [Mycena epipterygia]|nr:hypothetical protein C8R44DRAFT_873216 [Mycena epipterygia]